jgi:altronate dehydratase
MNEVVNFAHLARLPASGDNVAIATQRIEPGTLVTHEGQEFSISHTVLEGHRFALEPLKAGDGLLSWGLPFGKALRDVAPGEYVCNDKILIALSERHVEFATPNEANFADHLEPHQIDAGTFAAGEQVSPTDTPSSFMGFPRVGKRGTGTRNFVVVLGTTSRTGPFAEALAKRFENVPERFPNIDGVVAVAHTEGGGSTTPNNIDFVMRTLSGFMVHPNVGAIIAIDYGNEAYTNDDLSAYATANDYPLQHVTHGFFRISGAVDEEMDRAAALIDGWLDSVNAEQRSERSSGELKMALQCGGSDAFSGISGNALAGWVAKEIIKNGGSANLAETDELIGAEPYMLSNVRDKETAETFLEKIEIFKARAALHGASAEGNPSGGNNYRGLYNIALKSIGAARKRDPEVRLDYVIDYGAPMAEPGYYFMDSPGNDLESIAGQVAAGCNVITFITGNGSITNFPFVPTLKFVTTTGRFDMLANEMDVNAGRYNDGMSMDELGAETFDLTRAVASGQLSKGELAGHAQVSIWRNWRQTEPGQVEAVRAAPKPNGQPLQVADGPAATFSYSAYAGRAGPAMDQIGLIMPTSLCSGQVARLIAKQLNANSAGDSSGRRYVALVHTEGCGSVNAEDLYLRTLLGHLRHPSTRDAVLLEHGCEKVHNDAVRNFLEEEGEDISNYGWASVQLDGGLASVSAKVEEWFAQRDAGSSASTKVEADAKSLRIAILGSGMIADKPLAALAEVASRLVRAGATVVLAGNSNLANSETFSSLALGVQETLRSTISYGQTPSEAGLHVMELDEEDELESVTGLGASGVEIMLNYVGDAPAPAHPIVPLLQVSGETGVIERFGADIDCKLSEDASVESMVASILDLLQTTANGAYRPTERNSGTVVGFQLSRGPLGISL